MQDEGMVSMDYYCRDYGWPMASNQFRIGVYAVGARAATAFVREAICLLQGFMLHLQLSTKRRTGIRRTAAALAK